MSGVQITATNVNEVYASKINALNTKLKNGEVSRKDAENELLEFRKEHAAAFKAADANFSKEAAEAEAKDSASKAYSLELKMSADEVGRKAAEQAKAGQTSDGEGQKLSQFDKKLLGRAQQLYPESIVMLENGKVVVKNKTTGKIDEAKTKEAQSIPIDGTPIDTTLTRDSVNPHAKVGLVDKDDAKKMREYDTKQKAHNEFTDSTITKDDVKATKKEIKDAKKEIKDLQKQAKALRKQGRRTEAAEIEKSIEAKSGDIKELSTKYEKEKVLSSTKGERGIARAAKHNAKRYDKIDNVDRVLLPGQEADDSTISKGNGGKTVRLSDKQEETLHKLSTHAKYMISQMEEKLEASKQGGDTAAIKAGEEALEAAKRKYGDLAAAYDEEKGSVDVKKLQSGLAQFSGGDYKFNIDEKKALSAESAIRADGAFKVSKGDIASLAKAVGFGNESATKRRLVAGGITAVTTGLATIWNHKHSASAYARDEKSATAQDSVAFDEKTEKAFFKYMDSNGNPVYKEISVTAKAMATAKGLTATAVAEAVASASSKIPLIGRLAAPALAGVAAALIANPESKDAFNGNSVDTVLENLNSVSGKDNKKIVAQIQNMTITGDPTRDKAIKAAVISTSINGKANTEELLAAYESLKDTKTAIE